MLLSSLQLAPRKWSELLKDIGHRLPQTRDEYIELQAAILRERTLEGSVFSVGRQARNVPGSHGPYMVEEVEPRPLFLCLGDPGYTLDISSGDSRRPEPMHQDDVSIVADSVDICDGTYLAEQDEDTDSEVSSDEEQWEYESQFDTLTPEELNQYQQASDEARRDIYWAMRKLGEALQG